MQDMMYGLEITEETFIQEIIFRCYQRNDIFGILGIRSKILISFLFIRLINVSVFSFFYFSYHELGIYDIPATIDYIIHQTNCKQIFYIGHSQGTTQFWVTMSQKPDYNAKIKLMIGLAPVAFTGNLRGPITKLAKLTYMGVVSC